MTATAEQLRYIWITALQDDVDHAVTDEEATNRTAAHLGAFRAVCGAEFLPAAMECAPRPPCTRCVVTVRPPAPEPARHTRTRRRWWTRNRGARQ